MNMMLLMFMCVTLTLTEAAKYFQNGYQLKMEIAEFKHYNRSYMRDPTLGVVHYNRTYRAINCSFYLLQDLSMHLKAEYQAYKFLSNEYRFFPMTITIDVCAEIARDTFGLKESLQKFINVNIRCPLKRGLYRMTYATINDTLLPPYIPEGRYKNELKIYDNLNFVFEMHTYVAVEDIIKKWEN